VEQESPGLAEAVMLNPFAAIIQEMRHAVIDPSAKSAAAAAGGWEMLLIPGGIVLALAVIGFRVFDREAPYVADEL
jgi:ABC-2 type transport system permease protein